MHTRNSRFSYRPIRLESLESRHLLTASSLCQDHQLINNPVLDALAAEVYIDQNGVGSVVLDLNARKVSTSNIIYVNELFSGNGSVGNPYNDIPDAFDLIRTMGYTNAEIRVAAGNYSWGDAINPDFESSPFSASLNVIGNGSGSTYVLQGVGDTVAGLFQEAGRSLYVEGISFHGLGTAGTSINGDVFDARLGDDLTFYDVVFRDASNGDGMYVNRFDTVVVYDSSAIDNEADGFSYVKPADGGVPMYVLEVGLTATGNGQNGQANSQGSTMHRETQIVRVNGLYEDNPTNIEDTGLTSWNVNLTVQNSNVFQNHEGDFVNFRVRGDKIDVTNDTAWFISGYYGTGGIAHAHATTANDPGNTPIYGFIRYSSLFDIGAHPSSVLNADAGAGVFGPDDSQLLLSTGCNLVTHWDFDGDAVDQATLGQLADNGVITGATYVSGGLGQALQFDGVNDVMTVPTSPDINAPISQKSISLWFYPTDLNGSGRQVIYQQGGTARGLNVYLEGGQLMAGAWGDSWAGTWLAGAVTNNAWNHAALVLDSANSELRLYVNGTLVSSGFASSLFGHNPATLGAVQQGTRYDNGAGGYVNSVAADWYDGYVDEVRIYDQVLSATEVNVLANCTLSVPSDTASGLVTYWNMDDNVLDHATLGAVVDNAVLSGANYATGGLTRALHFDGVNDVMTTSTSADINTTFSEKSLSLWFYTGNLGGGGRQVIYQQGGTLNGMNVYLEGGQLVAGAWGTWDGTWLTGAVNNNAWNHVALVLNGTSSSLQLYLNGSLVNSGFGSTVPGHNPATLGAVQLGTRYSNGAGGYVNSTASDWYNGYIDEVRIYNRVLQAVDVAALASASLTPPV